MSIPVVSEQQKDFTQEMKEEQPQEQTQQEVAQIKEINPNVLWKLFKFKYVLLFRLCGECQGKLFDAKDKVQFAEGETTIKIVMCENCTRTNLRATDVLAPPVNGFKRKAEQES